MKKKAILFSLGLVFLTAGALVAALIAINALKEDLAIFGELGQRSIVAAQAAHELDAVHFSIAQSAKFAGWQAVYHLAENGGFTSKIEAETTCGFATSGYSGWNSPQSEFELCAFAPFEAYQRTFNKNLSRYIAALNLPATSFEVAWQSGALIGTSVKPLRHDISFKNRHLGEYSAPATFAVPFNYDFARYIELRSFAQALLDACELADFLEKTACVKRLTIEWGIKGPFGREDWQEAPLANALPKGAPGPADTFLFVVNHIPTTTHYDGPVQIRFALLIPSPLASAEEPPEESPAEPSSG